MPETNTPNIVHRRAFLAGTAASGALALGACATGFGGGFSFVDAIQRLLFLSSERAFARMLSGNGGFWDQQVAQLGLGEFLGGRGDVLTRILTSALFKNRLENVFADFAWDASKRAAPVVADTIRVVGYQNAIDLIRGGPTAATSFLRGNMGTRLIDVMAPDIGQAMRVAQDPLVGELLSGLTGVNVSSVANGFADRVDDVIWEQIGLEEAAIRRDPRSSGDAQLAAILMGGGAL